MKVCRTLLLCIIAIIWACPSQAQFVCDVSRGESVGHNVYWYGTGFGLLTCKDNFCIVAADEEPDTGGLQRTVLLESFDGGHNWKVVDPGIPGNISKAALDVLDSLNMFVSWRSDSGGTVIRTSDAGVTWQHIRLPDSSVSGNMSFSSIFSGMILADSGVFLTTDGGASWQFKPLNTSDAWQSHAYGSGKFRIFNRSGVIYHTNDDWATFDSTKPIIVNSGVRSRYIFYNCNFSGGDTMLACGWHLNFDQDTDYPYIARTSDGGRHWWPVYDDTSGPKGYVVASSNLKRDTIFASLTGPFNTMLWSRDNGVTWKFDTLLITDEKYRDENQMAGIGLNAEGELVGAFNYVGPNTANYSFLSVGHRSFSSVGPQSERGKLSCFPDPVSNSIVLLGVAPDHEIVVTDMVGREVLRAPSTSNAELKLDITSLPQGTYSLNDGISRIKFLKR